MDNYYANKRLDAIEAQLKKQQLILSLFWDPLEDITVEIIGPTTLPPKIENYIDSDLAESHIFERDMKRVRKVIDNTKSAIEAAKLFHDTTGIPFKFNNISVMTREHAESIFSKTGAYAFTDLPIAIVIDKDGNYVKSKYGVIDMRTLFKITNKHKCKWFK